MPKTQGSSMVAAAVAVYTQLKQLIHTDWKTRAAGATDASGRFTFRGFHGTYRVLVHVAGGDVEKTFAVQKTGPNELVVTAQAK